MTKLDTTNLPAGVYEWDQRLIPRHDWCWMGHDINGSFTLPARSFDARLSTSLNRFESGGWTVAVLPLSHDFDVGVRVVACRLVTEAGS